MNNTNHPAAGVLVLAATPIGDPRDASPRLAHEIATSDVVAAEDTRRFKRLCGALEVRPSGSVVSYHEHNEATRTPDLLARLVLRKPPTVNVEVFAVVAGNRLHFAGQPAHPPHALAVC